MKIILLTSNYQFTSSSIVSFVVDDAVGADVVAVVVVVVDVTLCLPNTSADPLTASEYSMLPIMAANKIKKEEKKDGNKWHFDREKYHIFIDFVRIYLYLLL